jgi:hypothetical protein
MWHLSRSKIAMTNIIIELTILPGSPGRNDGRFLVPLSTLGLVEGLSEIVSRCFAMEAATISSMLGDMEARVCFSRSPNNS